VKDLVELPGITRARPFVALLLRVVSGVSRQKLVTAKIYLIEVFPCYETTIVALPKPIVARPRLLPAPFGLSGFGHDLSSRGENSRVAVIGTNAHVLRESPPK
jgi:hypothetical protein